MTNNDSDPVIVGKSVEEIEAESGNRANSPVSGEQRQDDDLGVLGGVPALGVAGSGVSGVGSSGVGASGVAVPAVLGSGGLMDDTLAGSGADDGRGGKRSDES